MRTVALSRKAVELLAEHRDQRPLAAPATSSGRVRAARRCARTTSWHGSTVPPSSAPASTPLRFHDLRHTYAALMIAVNAHVKLLQHQMGHARDDHARPLRTPLPEMTGPVMDALDALTATKKPEPAAARVEAEWKDAGDPR